MTKRVDYCVDVYQAISECPDMPSVIDIVSSMGYRVVRGIKPHDKEYSHGHISIAHPDHDSYDNPIWVSGYKTINKRASWVVR